MGPKAPWPLGEVTEPDARSLERGWNTETVVAAGVGEASGQAADVVGGASAEEGGRAVSTLPRRRVLRREAL